MNPARALRLQGIRIERRTDVGPGREAAAILGAIVAALVVSAGLIATSGVNPLAALAALFTGAFGNWRSTLETLVQATPLIFTGLAMVVAFRARIWNIGAEGQFFAGAMAAAWISMNWSTLPAPVLVPLILAAAATAGALAGLIPGWLRARLGVNEIIVTVMMNFLVQLLLSYLLTYVESWSDPKDFYLQTIRFAPSTYLPTFFASRVHLGFFIALGLAALVYYGLWRTPIGYEIRAIGVNPAAAQYKGIDVGRTVIWVMLLSGAIAGLAGGAELSGLHHRLRLEISTGYGFVGIMVALLGRLHPLGVVLAAVFFGALVNGSTSMQIITGVPAALVNSVQGIVLIFLLATEVLVGYRVQRVKHVG